MIQVEPWNPVGRWKGEEHQIHPDLSRLRSLSSDWQWMDKDQSNHFFPDGIILRCPERIPTEQAFSIRVIWLVNGGELQTITANYDSNAQLIGVTHQALAPEG